MDSADDRRSHELEEFDDPTELVAAGYDRISEAYTEQTLRDNETRQRYLEAVLDRLLDGNDVLELGCGAGVPVAALLAERFNVTGVDLSAVQLARAREAVPGGRFVQADMSRLELSVESFDAVVAFYSIIHVPRERHGALFESIYSWLRPGGLFVASLAWSGDEVWIEHDYFGAPMYWSHFDAETNERMVRDAGFEIERAEVLEQMFAGEAERALWAVARRPK
jgi:cyclopropane fatty-acyl-phospholipid synthase-like methyltransferase